jgi:preprotein translocase subunit SecG
MIWETALLAVHVLVAAALVGFVLLQHGKGADMGAAFGSGSSGSLFGAAGSANFLSRTTAVLAAIFFATSLALAYLATEKPREAGSVVDRAPPVQQKKAEPAKPQAQPEKPAPAQPEKSVPQ